MKAIFLQRTAVLAAATVLLAAFASPTSALVVTEIMYDPASPEDTWEWIEVFNNNASAIDLEGYVLDDGNNTFHDVANIGAGLLEPGEGAVLYNADDLTAENFQAAWGNVNLVPVTDWGANALNNSGDTIAIWSSFDDYEGDETTFTNAVLSFAYDDIGDWPDNNNSASIYLLDPAADPSVATSWARSEINVDEAFESIPSELTGNAGDVGSPILNAVVLGLVGDYDNSGAVEQGDLDLVLNNWGQPRPFDPNGDPFASGSVDQEELDRVLNNWGSSVSPDFAGSSVPEPAAALLLTLSAVGLRRRWFSSFA